MTNNEEKKAKSTKATGKKKAVRQLDKQLDALRAKYREIDPNYGELPKKISAALFDFKDLKEARATESLTGDLDRIGMLLGSMVLKEDLFLNEAEEVRLLLYSLNAVRGYLLKLDNLSKELFQA